MVTIDQFLLEITTSSSPVLEEFLPIKETKILRSLSTLIKGGNFVTANQGDLLVKILSENHEKISKKYENLDDVLQLNTWSKPFRVLEAVRKLYLTSDPEKETKIILEFSFSAPIRKIVQEISKNLTSIEAITNGRLYLVELNEKNIVILIDALKNQKFSVDEKLLDYYNTIKTWSKTDFLGRFFISSSENQNFQKAITDDLGITTPLTPAIINDRRIRYQYFCDPIENPGNLTEIIAMRENTVKWVSRKNYSLEEVFKSLENLKRFPLLVILDGSDEHQCLLDLQNFAENLEKTGIDSGIGVYFRFDNTDNGKKFNNYIAEKKYNKPVDKDSKVVCIQNGKIPKFLIKNEWKPMSVMSIGVSLKNNKTSAYSLCCDLIIPYTDKEPIINWNYL